MARSENKNTTIPHFYFDWRNPNEFSAVNGTTCCGCGGTGKVILLISTRPCEQCCGTGRTAPAVPAHDSTQPDQHRNPSTPILTRSIYEEDRLIKQEHFEWHESGWRPVA